MNAQSLKGSAVTIKRDTQHHCWAVLLGAHLADLPVSDSADCVSVVSWLKGKCDGDITVKVELGS